MLCGKTRSSVENLAEIPGDPPLAPLKKGGTMKVPLFKGDLGGSKTSDFTDLGIA